MVPVFSKINLLVIGPVQVPPMVLLSAIVGFGDVLQQTPLAVNVDPPSFDTIPWMSTVVVATKVTLVVVVTVGIVAGLVVKLISFP